MIEISTESIRILQLLLDQGKKEDLRMILSVWEIQSVKADERERERIEGGKK